ncbi:site-2 protease family protein [Kordiimonas sp. SCSIO 12603]|uniref:site-2 protease family protein n=1 Tax=Kordiimonas sp. SCSIO 12603 TaxID=2829596 RepID=UPI002104BE9E|nr:site-2 protease family protein [Kordiimonas sp. SCSIO 12603]UTW57688.1 site-2 protease family protein [Kordiimonas sp. SCSIO 12603]
MFDLNQKLYEVSIMALPFLLAVTWREALRGYVAHKMGDWSVEQSGRLSANPLVHADPIWTGVVPVVAFVVLQLPILFGMAKPIQINPGNFKDINKGLLYVAISGPASLLAMIIFWAYIWRFSGSFGFTPQDWLPQTAQAGVMLSSFFFIIGLIPLPGLDGGKVLEHYLPYEAAQKFRALEPYGFFILLGIFFLLPMVIVYPAFFMMNFVASLVGV